MASSNTAQMTKWMNIRHKERAVNTHLDDLLRRLGSRHTLPPTGQTWYEYNCVSVSDDKQETGAVPSESQSLLTADDHDAHDEKNRRDGQSGDAQRLIICTKQTQNT